MSLRGIPSSTCRGLYIVGTGCEDTNPALALVDRCHDFSAECSALQVMGIRPMTTYIDSTESVEVYTDLKCFIIIVELASSRR